MKPLYIKKNGQVEKVTGAFAMPATYPAERVAYDNTTSGLSADDAQGAIDEIVSDLDDKVDKVEGKGLSTNDFTNEDKALIGQTLGNNTVLTTDKTPFLTRQTLNPTGFSGYVREKLIGASYAWNQLVQNGNFADSSVWTTTTASLSISSNIATMTASAKDGSVNQNLTVIDGHKYLITCDIKTTASANSISLDIRTTSLLRKWNVASSSWQNLSMIIQGAYYSNGYIRVIDSRSSGWDAVQIRNVQLVDLTLAFGSTIADYLYGLSDNGGITKLRDMGFPIDKYTPYGNYLVSSKTSGKKIVGKNLFNADILLQAEGWTKDSNGVYSGPTNTPYGIWKLANGGFPDIYFEPNKRYVFTCTGRVSVANKWMAFEYQYSDGTTSRKTFGNTTDATVTFVSDASKTVVAFGTIYGDVATCYMSNIQLEQGITATTYEPYSSTTYPLGNDELRGKFDLVNGEIVASGDVKKSNGEIDREWKELDLGSQNWTYEANGGSPYFRLTSALADAKKPLGSEDGNITCAIYVCKSFNDWYGNITTNMTCCVGSDGRIYVTNTAYNDATAFKTAMNGIMANYKLATPTTVQSTPFADPMSLVGATTEEYIDTRDIPCPVGAERQYMGQSEDVVEIPSVPHSDGVWVYKCYVSGGKAQYVWELEESDE